MSAACHLVLLGGLRADQAGRSITRFRTYKTGALLAYLAWRVGKPQPRETLIELFWPDCTEDAGRNSLSKALSSLRNQLEPPGVPAGAVLTADRATVGLSAANCTTDLSAFESSLAAASKAKSDRDRLAHLSAAVDLYGGELLPGYYEDWALRERERLAEAYVTALQALAAGAQEAGSADSAREYARRAIGVDPLHEASQEFLIRQCLDGGDSAGAVRVYQEWERVLAEEVGMAPNAAVAALVAPLIAHAPAAGKPKRTNGAAPAQPAAPATAADVDINYPLGTLTFLVVGVEDPADLKLVRDEITCGGGCDIQTLGAELVAAFGRASQGALCGAAAQRAVARRRRRCCVGLHTGEMADALDFAGEIKRDPLLQTALRVMRAAPEGRIFCTEPTAVLLRGGAEQERMLVDLGLYEIGPDGPPTRLFDLDYPGRTVEGPATPRAESHYKNNLPLQLTRFFGREEEAVRLVEALDRSRPWGSDRLWTLTGPGGMGKTRLSLETARRLLPSFGGAVWFVPLADVVDPRLMARALADALGLTQAPIVDPMRQVIEFLSARPSLLVLDNFEQLVAPTLRSENDAQGVSDAAAIVQTLLERVPALSCLVTSRQRLGLAGEREFALSPLAMPEGPYTPESLARCESAQLFADRAQAVRPDFQITPGNAEAVGKLCERLEGLPLAIELAAARSQVLTPAQMLGQLERRFDFLVSRHRNFALRHRTIRAAIDWSYALLTDELQSFLGMLSVFRGGWTLAAAEAVCAEPLALDLLAQLVECSLIIADESGDEVRFRQLETLRQYADELVDDEQRAVLNQRHLDYFTALAQETEPKLSGPDAAEWLRSLETEHDNCRAALVWCRRHGDAVETGLRLAAALCRLWNVHGHWTEGRQHLSNLLAQAPPGGLPVDVESAACLSAGILARMQSDYAAARSSLCRALSLARPANLSGTVAAALHQLSLLELAQHNQAAARALLDDGLAFCRNNGDKQGLAAILTNLGILAADTGDLDSAREYFREALGHRRALGDKRMVATLLSNLGNVSILKRDADDAVALLEESLSLQRELGDKWGSAVTLNALGRYAYEKADYAGARGPLEECLALFRELGDQRSIATTLCTLGTVAFMVGDPAARGQLVESLTLRWQLGDKSGVAFSLESLARMAAGSRLPERAACLWGVAEALREAIKTPLAPSDRVAVEEAVEQTRVEMEKDVFSAAWAHGRGLDLEKALALALED